MSNLWHYSYNNQQRGPVEEAALRELFANGEVNLQTLVWQPGMPTWVPLGSTALAASLTLSGPPPAAAPPLPPPDADGAAPSAYYAPPASGPAAAGLPYAPEVQAAKLEDLFKWYWILLAAGIPLVFVCVGYFAIIASAVIGYILLYRFWSFIQDKMPPPRTTPGQAVGFLFIPLFNLYWIFVAFHGLAQEMNQYCDAKGIACPRVNVDMALWTCILMVIPCGAIVGIVLHIMVMGQMKNTAVGILLHRAGIPYPVPPAGTLA